MSGLKFENLANVGDLIRAYDFEPLPGRSLRYIEGTVSKLGVPSPSQPQARCYEIFITHDSSDMGRAGDVGYVPFQTIFDYDNRVMLLDVGLERELAELRTAATELELKNKGLACAVQYLQEVMADAGVDLAAYLKTEKGVRH